MQIKLSPTNFNNAPISIQHNKNVCFKSILDDDREFGIDGDPEGQKIRDALRAGIYSRIFTPVRETESTNYLMRYANTIEDVPINEFRSLGNYSYSGESLMNHPEYFELLHASGIKKVVDLINDSRVKQKCDEYNLQYIPYDMVWGYGNKPIFRDEDELIAEKSNELSGKGLTKKEYDAAIEEYKLEIEKQKDDYITKFAEFLKEINLGGFYMACECGACRTVNCLGLISTFNPGWKGERIKPTYEYYNKFKQFYKNLTSEHKRILGFDEKFCKELGSYLKSL